MDLKRRTVGLTLPFIFGDAVAILCSTKLYCTRGVQLAVAALLPVTLAFVCFRLLWNLKKGRLPGARNPIPAVCMFLCGGLCGLNATIPAAHQIPGTATDISELARSSLISAIDDIGFSDFRCRALVRALLTGDRTLLDAGTKEAFRGSGASHILALSGFHLGVICLVISKLLAPFCRRPWSTVAKSIIICTVTGFYSSVTGGSPSIVRAFLFILLNTASGLSGRKAGGTGLLTAAMLIQLTISPLTVNTVSFQLSYLAMAGIVFIFPSMRKWWPSDKGILKKIWETCSLAISCQIFTAPAVMAYFGTFPRYFLLTNLIATPLVTLIMFLSLAATALSAAGACPGIIVSTDEKLMEILLFCLETISSL